jgi:hypothetical protein
MFLVLICYEDETIESMLRTVPDATEAEIVDWKNVLLRDRIKSVEGLRVTVGTSAWSSVGLPKRCH